METQDLLAPSESPEIVAAKEFFLKQLYDWAARVQKHRQQSGKEPYLLAEEIAESEFEDFCNKWWNRELTERAARGEDVLNGVIILEYRPIIMNEGY